MDMTDYEFLDICDCFIEGDSRAEKKGLMGRVFFLFLPPAPSVIGRAKLVMVGPKHVGPTQPWLGRHTVEPSNEDSMFQACIWGHSTPRYPMWTFLCHGRFSRIIIHCGSSLSQKKTTRSSTLIITWYHSCTTLFSRVGWLVPWPWNMSIILCGSFVWTSWEYSFTIHEFRLNLEVWVELYSRHSTHELLFIMILWSLLIVTTLTEYDVTIFTIFLLIKLTLFIGCVGVNFFLFSKYHYSLW